MENSNLSDEAVAKEKIRQERIENASWTEEERLFRNRWNLVRPKLKISKIPLSLALKILYRRSIFGQYLNEFNYQQCQNIFLNTNKLAMTLYDQKTFSENDWLYFKGRNDDFLMETTMAQLKDAIAKMELLNIDYFRERIKCIKLNNCFINELDDDLHNYNKLKIIHMNGNWLTKVPGDVFPRCLQSLNLYANSIDTFDDRIIKMPNISILGLGRNLLHNGSRLHLLSGSQSLEGLRSLDLSHNEICNLSHLLTCIKGLKHLTSLELEGNPCHVYPFYKDEILRNIPQLLYLDGVEILDKDRELFTRKDSVEEEAAIIFSCHRIIGLPPPPKQKGVIQTIHLEVTLPLLEEVIIVEENLEIDKPDTSEIETKVTKNNKKGQGKTKGDKNRKSNMSKSVTKKKGDNGKKGKKNKSKGSKKSKKKKDNVNLFYNAEDEYENELKSRVVNRAFCTERVAWSKVIQFPEDTIVIKSPEANNVTAIRDTFRTRVNVRLVYLKILIPQKPKKQSGKSKSSGSGSKKGKSKSSGSGSKKGKSKPSSKSKGKSGKKTNSVKSDKSDKKSQSPPIIVEDEEPKEIILKKVTLANFNCNLSAVSWSDKTLDFYWADHDDCKENAICVDGSLRAINYEDPNKKGKSKPPKTAKANAKGAKVMEVPENEQQALPKIFTVQVGFGLKRNYVL